MHVKLALVKPTRLWDFGASELVLPKPAARNGTYY
jgi:hypothetical protein